MALRALPVAALAGSILLSSCASPYFVHDPRTVVVDRDEVPRLLKSLRCEMVTFIAANNQRNMMFQAEAKLHGIRSAIEKYSYYEIDWAQFGALELSLQVQDTASLGTGTQFPTGSERKAPDTHMPGTSARPPRIKTPIRQTGFLRFRRTR